MISFFEGLILGLAYLMPIGSQNIFVIQSALNEGIPKSFRTAFIVSIMDISLEIFCFYGLGILLQEFPLLQLLLLGGGALFLIGLSYKLIKDETQLKVAQEKQVLTLSQVIRTTFVLTWFNPHAIIDVSLLLGTYRATVTEISYAYLLGICLASPVWFFTLTGVVGGLRHVLPQKFFRVLNILCAIVLLGFAFKFSLLFVDQIKYIASLKYF